MSFLSNKMSRRNVTYLEEIGMSWVWIQILSLETEMAINMTGSETCLTTILKRFKS